MTRGLAAADSTVEARLRRRMTVAPSGCWIWLGSIGKRSYGLHYGLIGIGGRHYYAHRVSYETFVGPIPAGYHVDHLCRRARCIRPDHLEAVTSAVNVRRGTSPGARAIRRGDMCLHGHRGRYVSTGPRRRCLECHRIRENARYQARKIAERAA